MFARVIVGALACARLIGWLIDCVAACMRGWLVGLLCVRVVVDVFECVSVCARGLMVVRVSGCVVVWFVDCVCVRGRSLDCALARVPERLQFALLVAGCCFV